ncbi:MAG: DUF3048 domain-containing protein [Mycobacteriales bacterium]
MRGRVGSVAGALVVVLITSAACGSGHSAGTRLAPASVPLVSAQPAPVGVPDPLTGLLVSPAVAALPALSIKIDNAPQARPQAGLDQADLVTESLVEGGLTRFLATFQAGTPGLVGPVRSARPVDAAILRALAGGLFAFSGAAQGEIAPSIAYSDADFLDFATDPAPFFREPGRYPPQNIFTSTALLRAHAAGLGYHPPAPPRLFSFSTDPLPGSTPVHQALVHMSSYSTAQWVWNPAAGRWMRFEDGTPHLAADGVQLSAVDVVCLDVQVDHSGIIDQAGHEDPFVLAYGSGSMTVLRDGVAEQGNWSRPSVSDPFEFTSTSGGPIPLAPGNIWIELVPVGGPFPVDGSLTLG